jgi:hypothetical protein
MIPQFLQNVSPAGRELLHHETRPGQPTSQLSEIGVGELEGWTLQFLTSLSHTPNWKRTVSLVNEYHQTLAHLAVLFRYTTLLEKVAQWGIDVDVQDVNGFTALHCAYLCGDLDSVGILKGYRADEDIEDNLGRRPLDMYIPSTNDLGKGSPSSDCTSSSAQIPTTGEEDWETVSMASSQSGSFSNHDTTMDLPASVHQSLHTYESTTSSGATPASISIPLPAGNNPFVTDNVGTIKGVSELTPPDSPISLNHTPSPTHIPKVTVAEFQYTRNQEQELKELKKPFNESNWHYSQDIQSTSSLQQSVSKSRRNSPNIGGDRDIPGEWSDAKTAQWTPSIASRQFHLLAAFVSIQILFLPYLPPSTAVEAKRKLFTHNRSYPFPNRLSRL